VKPKLIVITGLMLAATLACSLPGQLPGAPSGAVDETTEEEQAPAADTSEDAAPAETSPTEAPPTAETVVLNTCDLLSADEVTTALGEGPTGTYDPHFATCNYTAGSGQQLLVIAYQGQIAKDRTNEGMVLALEFLGNPTAQQLYDEIEPQLADMTIAEMADAFSPVEEAMGRDVTPHPELGDASYLVWIDGGSAQLGVVRGETVTSVVTIGIERATAESIVLTLTETVWARLPERFVPAPS
jgi:hypothetical protein